MQFTKWNFYYFFILLKKKLTLSGSWQSVMRQSHVRGDLTPHSGESVVILGLFGYLLLDVLRGEDILQIEEATLHDKRVLQYLANYRERSLPIIHFLVKRIWKSEFTRICRERVTKYID